MVHSLQNCCLFVFENKKQKPKTVTKNGKRNVLYGFVSLGEISQNEEVKSFYGTFAVHNDKENYALILETTHGTYHKNLQCTFSNFLDIIFEPQFLTSKKSENILKKPWVVGELNEMEVS